MAPRWECRLPATFPRKPCTGNLTIGFPRLVAVGKTCLVRFRRDQPFHALLMYRSVYTNSLTSKSGRSFIAALKSGI